MRSAYCLLIIRSILLSLFSLKILYRLCSMLLVLVVAPHVVAVISTSQQTNIPTEGWDGPGLGGAVVPWYLGWDNACASGDRGVTTAGGLSRQNVEAAIVEAMETWSSVAAVEFIKVGDSSLPGGGCIADPSAEVWDCDGDPSTFQINIVWASGDHCDGEQIAFDGPWNPSSGAGSVFAHAWGPGDIWGFVNPAFVGNIHLDNGENWVTSGATDVGGPGSGLNSVFIDIRSEVLHELGHSLGLGHPPFGTESVMEALSWDMEDRVLSAYDIADIQSLYDTPSNKPGVVMLFDLSGSMNNAANGDAGAPADQQRLSIAKRAAKPFLELLDIYGSGVAEFAIAGFSGSGASCLAKTETSMSVINTASLTDAIGSGAVSAGAIDALAATGSTPMLAGLQHALSLFSNHDEKAIVLLSDGYHNCPSSIDVGDEALSGVIAQLNGSGASVHAIGFGRPSDIDHPVLESLASETSGQFHDVTVAGFEPEEFVPDVELASTYKNILMNHLDLSSAVDPLARVLSGQPNTHEIQLSPYDNRVSFFVSWQTPMANRLAVTLRASDNALISEANPGVDIRRGENYHLITVDPVQLLKPDRVGEKPWTLTVNGKSLKANETETYQYSVILASDLTLMPIVEAASWQTGDIVTVKASLRKGSVPIVGASSVYAEVLKPKQGLGNWFAADKAFNQKAMGALKSQQVKQADRLGDRTLKARYLESQGLAFPGNMTSEKLPLFDDGSHGDVTENDGVYTNTYTDTREQGSYAFRIRASGSLADGAGFQREALVKRVVKSHFSASKSDVDFALDENQALTLTITPKDALGNYIGPGYKGKFSFVTEQFDTQEGMIDHLDGRYSQVFERIANGDASQATTASEFVLVFDGIEKRVSVLSPEPVHGFAYLHWLMLALILLLLFVIYRLLANLPRA